MNSIAVVGSRGFPSERAVRAYVSRLPLSTVIVSGGARGPDTWGETEALRRGMVTRVFRPVKVGLDWFVRDEFAGSLFGPEGVVENVDGAMPFQSFGHAAYARNSVIVGVSDAVVAFWDGRSKGTRNTVNLAVKGRLPYAVIVPHGERFAVESSERLEDLWIFPREGN